MGFAIAVDDDAILAARDEIASVEGLLMCPEGAATYAAYKMRAGEWSRVGRRVGGAVQLCDWCEVRLPAVTKHLDCRSPIDYEQLAASAQRSNGSY